VTSTSTFRNYEEPELQGIASGWGKCVDPWRPSPRGAGRWHALIRAHRLRDRTRWRGTNRRARSSDGRHACRVALRGSTYASGIGLGKTRLAWAQLNYEHRTRQFGEPERPSPATRALKLVESASPSLPKRPCRPRGSEISEFHAGMRDTARSTIAALLTAERDLRLAPAMLDPVAEMLRSAMTGLALWWPEHREVKRETLVRAIVQTTWHGLASAIRPDAT